MLERGPVGPGVASREGLGGLLDRAGATKCFVILRSQYPDACAEDRGISERDTGFEPATLSLGS